MATLYSYPLGTPLRSDLIIGSKIASPYNDNLPITQNYSIGSILDLVVGATGAQSLQQVTNVGQVNEVSISTSNVKFSGKFLDSAGTIGTDGQVLTSNATGNLIWSTDGGGTVTSVAATHAGNAFSVGGTPITSSGTLAITMNGITAQYVNGVGNLATLLDIPGLITSLTTTGTGAATLVGTVLNIPTPPTADFTSLTTTGTSGASTLTSGVLNIPEYATTEIDTLATVTARGATTAVASTFSGGLNSSGILTCNGTGANAYSYFTGNGGGAIPPSSFTHGMTQVWNNSSGSREWETFWATGADIEGDPAVPADGHAANAISYMSGYNRYAGASTSGTPVDTRMYKWYGNGELEILDMSTLPGGNARPTVSTPYITLPLSAGTNNSMLVRKSTKEVEFSASLSYNEALATLAILPASGTPSEIQMKSADNSIWKLAISNAGALVITGPF